MEKHERNTVIQLLTEKFKQINPQLKNVDTTVDLKVCGCRLGISSIQFVELLMEVEDEFGIIADKNWNSIEDIADAILNQEISHES